MIYRKATLDDIPVLIELRKKQLIDEGIPPNAKIDEELSNFFHETMNDHSLVEWVVEDNGTIIATAAIVFYRFLPTYTNVNNMKGYIANMYTREDYRKRGIATSLLDRLVAEAKARGIKKLWLGASTMGRPVYEKFGFKPMDRWLEMDLYCPFKKILF